MDLTRQAMSHTERFDDWSGWVVPMQLRPSREGEVYPGMHAHVAESGDRLPRHTVLLPHRSTHAETSKQWVESEGQTKDMQIMDRSRNNCM